MCVFLYSSGLLACVPGASLLVLGTGGSGCFFCKYLDFDIVLRIHGGTISKDMRESFLDVSHDLAFLFRLKRL